MTTAPTPRRQTSPPGNPFLHLKSLRPGDAIYVTTQYETYKYVVTGEKVVRYTEVSVLAPGAGEAGRNGR